MRGGGAVEGLGRRIGRIYLAACAAVFLTVSASTVALQYATARAEAESACANLAQIALDEMSGGGLEGAVAFARNQDPEVWLRVTAQDGTVLAESGRRSGVTVSLGCAMPGDGSVTIELGYPAPPLVTPKEVLLLLASGIGAALVALLTRRRVVAAAIGPVAESARRQREFVAAASHELKSPLSVIALDLEAVAREAEDPASVRTLSKEALGECMRTASLVEDLLSLASGDADGWRIERRPCDAVSILADAYEQMEDKASSLGRGINLSLPDGDDPMPLNADPERIVQVLRILIENALVHTPEKTLVVLGVSQRGDCVAFAVSDDGPGIPDEVKPRIFERFFRADGSRSDRSHHGLGLSIAREIARAHGGDVTVRDRPGGGSVFELLLPRGRKSDG